MHDRIVILFAPLLLVVAAGLGILLAVESAQRMSREAELARRDDLAALLADPDGLAAWGADRHHDYEMTGPTGTSPSDQALAPGPILADDITVWPWTDGDWILEGRIGTDGPGIRLAFSTDPVQDRVAGRWAVIVAAVLTIGGGFVAITFPLTRWALRPVRQLDRAATELAGGNLDAEIADMSGAPELRQVAATFNHMARRVAAAVHRERAFVANASHHLGNLMTPLRLRIESLPGDDTERFELLAEFDRLEQVAQRLLELHAAEEQRDQLVPVDVGALVDELLPLWQAATGTLGIELRRQGSAHATAMVIPGAIEEVLDNLLDNALKYGAGAPITIRVVRGLHQIRLVVRDEGPGLDPDELARAQGRFWRGPAHQNLPGAGLGLAIVDALAARCSGSFDLRSSPGRGLEAVLSLPGTDGPAPVLPDSD